MAAFLAAEAASAGRRPVPSTERPVDLVHLVRQTLGDRALEREVLQLFLCHSESCLVRLREASDAAAWIAAAHSLKGSARGIGAWRVARAAERAETADGFGAGPACAEALRALAAEVAAVTAFIGELLSLH